MNCLPRGLSDIGSCGESQTDIVLEGGGDLSSCLATVLAVDGVTLSSEDFDRLLKVLEKSIVGHEKRSRYVETMSRFPSRFPTTNMYRRIWEAIQDSDRYEAFWRSFLLAHFGEDKQESAFTLLSAFGQEPYWTWERVHSSPQELREWLEENAERLRNLKFGNHRKYESNKPRLLWGVIESFLHFAGDDPVYAFDVSGDTPAERFDILYHRLDMLKQFGRTGRFDFIDLLRTIGLVDATPTRPYLAGSTGPLQGAKKLWGDLPVYQLEALATGLSTSIRVSPSVIEDTLCHWQKG